MSSAVPTGWQTSLRICVEAAAAAAAAVAAVASHDPLPPPQQLAVTDTPR